MSEVVEDQEPKKRRGRPKNMNYLPWEEAREAMRMEMLPSRGKFFEWWDRNKPKAIPRFPYRVYTEWVSWNDFLGTDNKFNEKIGTKWRPFLEAVAWANKRGLKNQTEWMEYARSAEDFPEDIPARPDVVYNEWRGWTHWLGYKTVEAVQTQQELAQKIQVYYIIREQGAPNNVFTFGVEPLGQTVLRQRWERQPFDLIKLFWYDPSKEAIVRQIVTSLSSPYVEQESQRIVPNLWEIIWHLQMHLDLVKKLES